MSSPGTKFRRSSKNLYHSWESLAFGFFGDLAADRVGNYERKDEPAGAQGNADHGRDRLPLETLDFSHLGYPTDIACVDSFSEAGTKLGLTRTAGKEFSAVEVPMTTAKPILNFKTRLIFWALGAVLGFSQAWTSRFDAIDYTVSYLDMGSYFFHGHHWAIINGFWSPLYALLFGLAIAVLKPSMYWEYPTVHLVVFIIFLFTMTCFDYFLRQLMKLRSDFEPEANGSPEPGWVWITIGYTIFLWCSLQFIGANKETPDMLVAGFFYLSCGLLVMIWTGLARWGAFLGLGLTLGLSYLTKSVTLPISLLFLVAAALVAKQKARYVVISAIAFVTIAAPFIAALSTQQGKFTYGESTTYDYAVTVNGIPHHHWQGDPEMPLAHPAREIFAAPATFEFREPFQGTYPPEYDLTYWYQGVKLQVHFLQEFKVFGSNVLYEFETIFWSLNGILLATLFLAAYQTGRGWLILKDVRRFWFLILPCVAAAGLYALVYYNAQYLAASFVVLWLCLFLSTVSAPKSRLLSGIAVLQFVMFFGLFGVPSLLYVLHIHAHRSQAPETASFQQVAEQAARMGLRPGDEIASLNASNTGMAMWAHLARVQIIAEVYYWPGHAEAAMNNFWNADPVTQEKVIEKLSQTGARAIVSQDTPSGAGTGRWLEIGTTGYYLYWLKPSGTS